MSEHTATPWRALAGPPTYVRIVDSRDAEVARVHRETDTAQAEANALFIVRAVNAHAELVAALAYVIRNAVANGASWSPDVTTWANGLRHTQPDNVSGGELVRAALALVEKGD